MEKVTYIIPIHELKEDTKKLLATALESLENVSGDADDELLLVGPLDIIKEVFVWYSEEKENSRFKEIGLVPNDGSTDFFTQVNLAAKKCSTKYFSILELDDTYEPYWNKTVQEYAESTGASVVLPLNAFIVNGKFSSFGNEVVWSTTFAQSDNEVLGYISEDCLHTFIDFSHGIQKIKSLLHRLFLRSDNLVLRKKLLEIINGKLPDNKCSSIHNNIFNGESTHSICKSCRCSGIIRS